MLAFEEAYFLPISPQPTKTSKRPRYRRGVNRHPLLIWSAHPVECETELLGGNPRAAVQCCMSPEQLRYPRRGDFQEKYANTSRRNMELVPRPDIPCPKTDVPVEINTLSEILHLQKDALAHFLREWPKPEGQFDPAVWGAFSTR